MNSYQIEFLIFMFLPPILSIVIDKLTYHVNKFDWIPWFDSIVAIYLFEIIIWVIVSIYIIL